MSIQGPVVGNTLLGKKFHHRIPDAKGFDLMSRLPNTDVQNWRTVTSYTSPLPSSRCYSDGRKGVSLLPNHLHGTEVMPHMMGNGKETA